MIEAAALHGFPNFTSESRPSDLNGWKGDLYFSRETRAGVEQLFVEFAPSGDVVAVGLFAVASGSTSDQVIRAITDRLGGL
ncbi:MAG: hypothetical protein HY727_04685 [Candidatus Rokubacteria bacterium]|nr:hypothetical protein [Candidatus Rokubacteria bacterium]